MNHCLKKLKLVDRNFRSEEDFKKVDPVAEKEANKDVMDWLREMNKTDNRLRQGGVDNNEIFSTGKENSN
jgi:hypothetical protein